MSPEVAAWSVVMLAGFARLAWAAYQRRLVREVLTTESPVPRQPTQLRALLNRVTRQDDSVLASVELIEAVGIISRSVAAGTSLAVAINEAHRGMQPGRIRTSLGIVTDASTRVGLVAALRGWGNDQPHCRRVALALAVSAETGGDPVYALDALTDSLRTDMALTRELTALTSQSRLSAGVLAVVPIGFGALMTGTDPDARRFLLSTLLGQACLLLGLSLDAIAWRWLRSIAEVGQ